MAEFVRRCNTIDPSVSITDSAIQKYLKKGALPRMDTLVVIARAAGVSIDWLATGEGDRRVPAPRPAGGTGHAGTGRRVGGSAVSPAPEARVITEGIVLGAAFTIFGEERITVDLLIRGPSERLVRSLIEQMSPAAGRPLPGERGSGGAT